MSTEPTYPSACPVCGEELQGGPGIEMGDAWPFARYATAPPHCPRGHELPPNLRPTREYIDHTFTVRNGDSGYVRRYAMCPDCGSIVGDKDQHNAWHAGIGR